MPNIKCPVSITCGGPTEVDDPRANFSSEAPDVIRFAAVGWAPPPLDPTLPPKAPPTVTDTYFANGCLSLCFSTQSQAAADACAAAEAYLCALVGHDGDTNDRGVGGGPEPDIFYNTIQQCSYVCPDGTTFTTTIPAGTVPALTQFEADHIAHLSACLIASTAFICLGSLTSTTCNGTAYLSSTTAVGGRAPMTFTVVSGALPPGLNLSTGPDGRTLILSGVTTTPGIYPFQIAATDANANTLYKVFTIAVVGVDQGTLSNGSVGVAYSQTLTAANMTLPLSWVVSVGTLPTGLSLNSTTGEISGTPTTAETANFTISVADGAGLICTRQMTITINASMTCPVSDGTFDPGTVTVQGLIAAKDTAISRYIVFGVTCKIFDADTDAFIANSAVNVNPGGCWIPTTQKFCSPNGAGGFNFINAFTGAAHTLGGLIDCRSLPDFAADEATVYGVGQDPNPPNHCFVTRADALAEVILTSVDIGASVGAFPDLCAYCPSPKRLLTGKMTTFNSLDLYSLPGCALLASIDLAAAGWGGSYGSNFIYHPGTQHFYVAIERDDPTTRQEILELDPLNLAVIHTFDLGESGIGNVIGLDYNPDTGEIYAQGRTLLTAINPFTQTIICQVASATSTYLGVDRFSRRIKTSNFGTNRVGLWH